MLAVNTTAPRPLALIVPEAPARGRPKLPDLEIDKLIPQPLRTESVIHVRVELPREVRQLAADLHADRFWLVGAAVVLLLLLAAATVKYVADWRQR